MSLPFRPLLPLFYPSYSQQLWGGKALCFWFVHPLVQTSSLFSWTRYLGNTPKEFLLIDSELQILVVVVLLICFILPKRKLNTAPFIEFLCTTYIMSGQTWMWAATGPFGGGNTSTLCFSWFPFSHCYILLTLCLCLQIIKWKNLTLFLKYFRMVN